MSPAETDQSPLFSANGTGNQPSPRRSNGFSGSSGGRSKVPRLEFGALSSRTTQSQAKSSSAAASPGARQNQFMMTTTGERSTLRNAKSPWQNRGGVLQNATTSAAPSPWNNARRSRTEAASRPFTLVTATSNARTRRYRPNAVGLMGGSGRRFYRRGGEFDPDKVSQALVSFKEGLIKASANNSGSSSVVRAVKGKIQWGSESRPSRLPRPAQKRQRSDQQKDNQSSDERQEDYEGESHKKRKKVSFNENGEDYDVVVQKISATQYAATPAGKFKSAANRKGTPMPPKRPPVSAVEEAKSPEAEGPAEAEETGTPSSSTLSESLPMKPPGINFRLGDRLKFTAEVKTFDPPLLSPAVQANAFDWSSSDTITRTSTNMYGDGAEWDSMRFEKAKLTMKKPKPIVKDTSDDQGTQEQSTKRTKKAKSTGNDDEQTLDWTCDNCGTINAHDESQCTKCRKTRRSKTNEGWGNLFKDQLKKWKCVACSSQNEQSEKVCKACETARSGYEAEVEASANKKSSTAGQSSSTSAFTFQAQPSGADTQGSSTSSSSKFVFGAPTGKLPMPSGEAEGSGDTNFTFGAPPASSTSTSTMGGFNFATSTPAPIAGTSSTGDFVFGAPKFDKKEDNSKESSSASSPKPFSFGTASKKDNEASASAPASKPTFNFGAPKAGDKTKSDEEDKSKTESTTSFTSGSSSKLSASAKPFTFGATGENGNKNEPGSQPFGSSATSTAQEDDKAKQGGFSFLGSTGAGQDNSGNAPSTSFGSSSAGPAKRSRGYDLGETAKTPGQNAAPAPAPFSFGQDKSSTSGTAATPAPSGPSGSSGGFSFGSSPGAAPAPSAPGFSFTGGASAKDETKTGDSNVSTAQSGPTLFGAPAPPSENKPPFNFGDTPAPVPAKSTGGFAFGANNTSTSATPSFGGTTPAGGMNFGSGQAPTPATESKSFSFGASSQTPAASAPATSFGASAAPAPTTFGAAPGFGGAPAPAPGGFSFGSQAPAPSFGSSQTPGPTPAFGTQAAPPPGFGNQTNAPGFGTSQAPAPTPGFGNQTNAPGFGTSQAPAPTPGFGSNQHFGGAPAASTQPFGSTRGFGSQQTSATPSAGGFNAAAFSGGASQTPGGFGAGATPATGGFGGGPQPGFSQTPGPAGGFGGAPQGGFNIGSAAPKSARGARRIVKAKRPTRG